LSSTTATPNRIVPALFEEFWSGDMAAAGRRVADDAVVTTTSQLTPTHGLEGVRRALASLGDAFPDAETVIADAVGVDGIEVVRVETRGTHRGELFGFRPTGRSVSISQIAVTTLRDGRVVKLDHQFDLLGLLEDLGVMTPIEEVPYPAIWALSKFARLRRSNAGAAVQRSGDTSAAVGNAAIAERVLARVFNGHDVDAADALFAPDVRVHHPVSRDTIVGVEGFKDLPRKLLEGFPDLHVVLEHAVAEGDRVGARWTIYGTNNGRYRRVPATGRRVEIPVQEIIHLRDGRISEMWFAINLLGVAQQLGVLPSLRTLAKLARVRPTKRRRSEA
jgi:steroid delta-isomerase-like uncharacterized protein